MTIEIRTKVKYLRRKFESLEKDIKKLEEDIKSKHYIIDTYKEYQELIQEEILNLINSL